MNTYLKKSTNKTKRAVSLWLILVMKKNMKGQLRFCQRLCHWLIMSSSGH